MLDTDCIFNQKSGCDEKLTASGLPMNNSLLDAGEDLALLRNFGAKSAKSRQGHHA
jgi:hypothetical protein